MSNCPCRFDGVSGIAIKHNDNLENKCRRPDTKKARVIPLASAGSVGETRITPWHAHAYKA